MSLSISLFTTAFCMLASAMPAAEVYARAGGPAIVPVPSTCTVTSPLPTSPDTLYLPGPAAMSDLLYSAYYSSFSSNKSAMAEQCLQQCYGYGYHVECKTEYWAENVEVPKGYYGSPGGQLSTACLLFKRPLTNGDFVAAPAGQATDASAGNIVC